MKKISIILFAILLFTGCMTNPVKEKNYSKYKKPWDSEWVWAGAFFPPFMQLINGEYIEALLYGAIIYPTVLYGSTLVDEDPSSIPGNILVGIGATAYVWSYVDAIHTTKERSLQWKKIAYEKGDLKLINMTILKIGMTSGKVLESFPFPNDINKSSGSWGTREQWVYERSSDIGDEVYLYFENGKLISWQE